MIQENDRGWRRGVTQREILVQLPHSRPLTENQGAGGGPVLAAVLPKAVSSS